MKLRLLPFSGWMREHPSQKWLARLRSTRICRTGGGRNSAMVRAMLFREAGSGAGMKAKSLNWNGK
jgi:hypothetical protein